MPHMKSTSSWCHYLRFITLPVAFAFLVVSPVPAQETDNSPPPRGKPDLEKVHDLSTVMVQGEAYRFFSTGGGVSLMREQPDGRWLAEARLFDHFKEASRQLLPRLINPILTHS